MKRQYIKHGVLAAGILAFGFLFWCLLFPVQERPLTVTELRKLLIEGTTPEERALGAAGLGQRGDTPSIPLLLAAMEDESPILRARAGVAVKKILGTDFYFHADDPPEKRAAALEKYKVLWEAWKAKTGYTGELSAGAPAS